MVSMRLTTVVLGAALASSLLVAAAPATTPVPNRRTLIGRDTYKEIAKRSSRSASDCGFTTSDYGKCYQITDTILSNFINSIWSLIAALFGGSVPSTSSDALCLCVGYNNDLYCPSSKSIPSSTYFSYGLTSSYTSHTTCNLPKYCTPNPSTSKCCDYTCTYGSCGSGCLASGQTCVSGVAVNKSRKRSMTCPAATSRCLTSDSANSEFECVNTMSDLYSCGGCLYADANTNSSLPTGQDCTAIPNVSEVACQRGTCVIEACEPGYKNVPGQGCVFSEKLSLKLQKYRL